MFKFIDNKSINMFGYELDFISSRISQILYPTSQIHNINTIEQKENIPKFDFIIGNPPFGDKIKYNCEWGNDKNNKIKPQTIDNIFLDIAINHCKESGYIAMIVPDGTLSNSTQKPIRQYIFKECKLIGVISLPPETFLFSGIGGTGAKTSILILQKLRQEEKIYSDNGNGVLMSQFQKSVFMAVVDSGGLGWDNKGKETGKDDLKIILEAFKKGCEDIE
jgi:type I restriction-modification system DNA methylase subunit